MMYPRVAWSLLPALVGGVAIAFGFGDGPVGLADDLGSQPSTWWTDAGQTDHCEDYEYTGGEESADDRKSYFYQGYKYVEAAPSESGNKDEEEDDSCEYDGARETGFTVEYDERYAEAHMHDVRGDVSEPYNASEEDYSYEYEEYEAGYEMDAQEPDTDVALDYRGYSDAYPNEEDAYPEDLENAAAGEVYSYQYEYSYPEAKYGNVEALSNEIEQAKPENTSDPDDFNCFGEADEAASGETGDEESQWFGPYDDDSSVLDAVRSWTVRSLDELAMAIHGVSERISAQ